MTNDTEYTLDTLIEGLQHLNLIRAVRTRADDLPEMAAEALVAINATPSRKAA